MKVYGYVRVSGESQVDKDGPVRQELALEQFCAANGLELERVFQDLAVSGTVEGMDRPGFFAMLEETSVSGVKIIVIEKLERLARDLIVSEMMIREFRSRAIVLYTTDQGKVDLVSTDNDPSRKLIRQMFSAIAEYEKTCLVLKLRAARERVKLKTGRCGGRRPYGQDNVELRLMELIANLRNSGVAWSGIAALLSENKVKKRNGSTKWHKSEAYGIFAHQIPKVMANQ